MEPRCFICSQDATGWHYITIAASSEEEARKIITEMFPGDSELNIIQVYRVADCPQMGHSAEKNTPSKRNLTNMQIVYLRGTALWPNLTDPDKLR